MRGQPGHNTRVNATQIPGHGYMDDLTTERSYDVQAMWIIDVLGFFIHFIHRRVYNQALADVRSTGAGIKCQHCRLIPLTASLVVPKCCISSHIKRTC